MFRKGLLLTLLLGSVPGISAQELEGLIVEVYHVNASELDRGPTVGPLPAGAVTYRIFLDLPAGHQVQAVYGDRNHPLFIGTTGRFYNEPHYGKETGDDVQIEQLKEGMVALDSWVTIAYATEEHVAVLKRHDTDGSILSVHLEPGMNRELRKQEGAHISLTKADGLMPADSVIEVVQFGMDFLPLAYNASDDLLANDSLLHTSNGAWAVLGGAGGATQDNHLLIAQLTTDGTLYYAINVQVEAPDGSTTRWVWSDPLPGESLASFLSSGNLPRPLPTTGIRK